MTNQGPIPIPCAGMDCSWNFAPGDIGCQTGGGGCFNGILTQAQVSNFHPVELVEATDEINAILKKLQPADPNMQLSLIDTKSGLMLVWVDHNRAPQPGDIDQNSDRQTIINALGITP